MGVHGVRANANLQQIDYQHGFDDDIAQFAIQYGSIVGFSACMPAHAHGVHTGNGRPAKPIAS